MIPATGFVVAASMGWMFYASGLHRLGNSMLALSLAGLWSLAVIHEPLPRIATVHSSPSTLHAAELSVNDSESTVWVSTLERRNKVYHRPTCNYVALMDENKTSHKRPMRESEAIAAGYGPCQRCFSTQERLARQ